LDLKRNIRDGRHRLWWRSARSGNEQAFRRLYGELYAPVASYVSQRVNNQQDAEDIVSQIFQRFLQRFARFDAQQGSLMTWVLAMARNAVIDHYRQAAAFGAARRDTVDVTELADDLVGITEVPLVNQIADEERDQLRQWLRRQPADLQEMFALRYGQGLGLKEVAQVLHLSESAVKQRFARATKKIRQELLTEFEITPTETEVRHA